MRLPPVIRAALLMRSTRTNATTKTRRHEEEKAFSAERGACEHALRGHADCSMLDPREGCDRALAARREGRDRKRNQGRRENGALDMRDYTPRGICPSQQDRLKGRHRGRNDWL